MINLEKGCFYKYMWRGLIHIFIRCYNTQYVCFETLNKCPRSINYEEKTAPTPQKYYISATHEYRDMTIYILLHVNGFYIIHKDYTESNYIIIAKKFVHILSYKLI